MSNDTPPMPLGSAEDRQQIWRALNHNEVRIESLETTLPQIVHNAVREAMPNALLSTEQHRWVELAIERESQSIAFRRAVIEKTTVALVWSIIAGFCALVGLVVRDYAIAHGMWRP